MIERLRGRIPAGAAGEFSSPGSTWCADSYSVSVPPACYRSGMSTRSQWADYAAVQALCGNLSGNELTRNLSGNIREQASQLAEPLWTDSGIRSGINARKLISTSETKQNKKRRRKINGRPFSQILASEEKATTTTTTSKCRSL